MNIPDGTDDDALEAVHSKLRRWLDSTEDASQQGLGDEQPPAAGACGPEFNAEVERDGAECVCWKENDNVTPRANEAICPKHRSNVDVPTAWEMLRQAAGYFQAIEEQLRPLLAREQTPDEFRRSAYGTAMETAANIAMHQRVNIEREGVEAARIQVSVMSGDMRGENALAWLAGALGPEAAGPRRRSEAEAIDRDVQDVPSGEGER